MILLTSTLACAVETASVDRPFELENTAERAADPLDTVCDVSAQVALFDDPVACTAPVGPSWSGEAVFQGSAVPSGLRRYCAYSFDGSATAADVEDLEHAITTRHGTPFELGVDCQAVEPQNTAITDAIGPDLHAFFDWMSGHITADQAQAAVQLLTPAPIHTAVVDTYPQHPVAPPEPNSTHGPVVASVIESFLCPSGGCNAKVRTYLGLPRTADGLDLTDGGQVGRQSDLARGIFAALVADQASGSDHLVINLSVAWEAEEFGGMNLGDMDPAARAVYDVIRVARCRGALIVAAAGNQSGISCTGEAMAPARWEGIAAPAAGECTDLGIANPFVDPVAGSRLVHAVGGLFGPNTPMANSRGLGMPRLAAAASHTTASTRQGLQLPAVRTGTSIAAAVTSATASLVWSYRPELSPSEVMNALYNSGSVVSGVASDFGAGGPVRRVDACAAFNHAVPAANLPCQSTPTVSLSDLVAGAESAVTVTDTPTMGTLHWCFDSCGNPYTFQALSGSAAECEAAEPDPWRWLTSPQPTRAGCPDCVLTADSTSNQASALLTVGEDFEGYDVLAAKLEVIDDLGETHFFGVTEKDLAQSAVEPTRTAAADYDVSVPLDGLTPLRAFILLDFEEPSTGEYVSTRDAMIVRVE
ncbi:MAG: S8/S53 family peptidase [Nannocystaceae bacterium]|nr:S8/S53 family peptidase [bacterium]